MAKFGHYDDVNREYVIENPKTPYPWINYLGNEKFFSLISNTAGGYAFYTDARLRRLTRYRYNDMPLDCNGRYFFIKDGSTIIAMVTSLKNSGPPGNSYFASTNAAMVSAIQRFLLQRRIFRLMFFTWFLTETTVK